MATAQVSRKAVSIHNVLIATDFSRQSNAATRYGLELARRYEAGTHIVYVTPTDEYLLSGPEALMYARDAARRDLLELKGRLKEEFAFEEGSEYHVHFLEGPIAEAILEAAREYRADLIVLATHGRGGLAKMLMGSVAERVFRRSTIPVLTIGPCVRHRTVHPKNILLAADCSPASREAVGYACSLARENRAVLTVVHAMERVAGNAQADPERVKTGIEQKLAEIVQPEAGDLEVRYRVAAGQPVPTILDSAVDCEADYIVLGVQQHSGVLNRFMWPTAYGVVREAYCPVLTVRHSGGHYA